MLGGSTAPNKSGCAWGVMACPRSGTCCSTSPIGEAASSTTRFYLRRRDRPKVSWTKNQDGVVGDRLVVKVHPPGYNAAMPPARRGGSAHAHALFGRIAAVRWDQPSSGAVHRRVERPGVDSAFTPGCTRAESTSHLPSEILHRAVDDR